MVAQFLVELQLLLWHVTVNGLFELLGELFGHLPLRPPQNERPQSVREQLPGFLIVGICGVQLEDRRPPKHSGIEKLEDRP